MPTDPESIRLRGVRQNNLKGFDLDIPLGQLTVVTGLSGSGKSSLVFDTLHAEGQRRYVETFSPYTRQFLEMLSRPDVDSIENIRPSIAIEQSNTVKTTRSTVGTMTELTDFFKVWFASHAHAYDPKTGKRIEDDNPQTIWRKTLSSYKNKKLLVSFRVDKPKKLKWTEILKPIKAQGYTRVAIDGRIEKLDTIESDLGTVNYIYVIQDRIQISTTNKNRFLESTGTALHFGHGHIHILDEQGQPLEHFTEGLHSPETGLTLHSPTPALFSFNSPVGACPCCRGFGRIIETDDNLIIPDHNLSIDQNAIRPFTGEVFSESLRDLQRAARKHGIRTDVPWAELDEQEKHFVMEGEPDYVEDNWQHSWYGVRRFFTWLEGQTYKMHVRVFLSKYRAYVTCPSCKGARLQPEALYWKWQQHTLPQLYELPVSKLLEIIKTKHKKTGNRNADLAADAILTRLGYLEAVGLGYLTLNRSSRTLSGGEVERVNLTACLGTALTDTLFVLDEPSVGLHARDIDRLISLLRSLTSNGNTVVVVEHDEAIIRAADHLVELGPESGKGGGHLVFSGSVEGIELSKESITGAYLSGRKSIEAPGRRRTISLSNSKACIQTINTKKQPHIAFKGARMHNIQNENITIPLERFVCLSGVSGSGKSTLLNNVIYQGLQQHKGLAVKSPAAIKAVTLSNEPASIELVDQSAIARTPRSNPALYADVWDAIRILFASTEEAKSAGMTASHFSFNAGNGRCEHCKGLGYELVEMQFLSDVYVPCPVCEGKRFKDETLSIAWNHKNVLDVLTMDIRTALDFFADEKKIAPRLQALCDVGLHYLSMGQPLNTLSGGESQRLKLVKHLANLQDNKNGSLFLLDEPTTGLHRHDIAKLLEALQKLVDAGHSLIVIEHNMDILKAADWIIEMGPDAGSNGGKVVTAGTPEHVSTQKTHTAHYLNNALDNTSRINFTTTETLYEAAEKVIPFDDDQRPALEVIGAREHNLKDISVRIPHNQLTVVTGVSGSGKSTLAFDIIFAEGQRRFMESISAYARQFVEQLPRPDIDQLTGIAPTVAIEQRVTHGTRKSTVATITEVAQYLRLLFARIGTQHSIVSNKPLQTASRDALYKSLQKTSNKGRYLCAPLIRGRKGHHQPLADWAIAHGYEKLRIDGKIVDLANFKKLDRYKEHDIEVIVLDLNQTKEKLRQPFEKALELGKGTALVCNAKGAIEKWFSTERVDPESGDAYPALDPKNFSWNSPKGWCPVCHGYGFLADWMAEREDFNQIPNKYENHQLCPSCAGQRLNQQSLHVYLYSNNGYNLNLAALLAQTSQGLLNELAKLKLTKREKKLAADILVQIKERLEFMGEVGLDYLTLDRATATLSGGEAQRIRLAAQLGSNLSGVLYVLDEPSIGLHARDNERLLSSMNRLKANGNSLLVVEHNDETMRAADCILDMGLAAGVNGGELIANGPLKTILKHKESLTAKYLRSGIAHPLRGEFRKLPKPFNSRSTKTDWLALRTPSLRNLKGQDATFALERLNVVCGISGAGKSTLVKDLLKPIVEYAIKKDKRKVSGKDLCIENNTTSVFKDLYNGQIFRSVIEVNQEPIGKTPRSTPATYIGAYDLIRELFAQLPESRMRGFTPSTFSFNTKGGRCENCKGAGRVKLEMNFLPDTWVDCDECGGSRFGSELSDVTYNGKTIGEILQLSFDEAADFFNAYDRLSSILKLMSETGLGYLTLGQPSPTLSGGEAQRLKLVSELAQGLPTYKDKAREITRRNLYLLEEPTIGLHMADVEKLLLLLHRLVDQGHTVIVIEHHMDVIADADYIIEIGPEGGDGGGEILYQGAPSAIRKNTPTSAFLQEKYRKGTSK